MSNRTWSSVVRGSGLNPNAKEFYPSIKFYAFCRDCGEEAEVCANGCDRPPIWTHKGKKVCGGCLYDIMWRIGSESMSLGIIKASEKRNDPPFRCKRCAFDLKN
jgi:hypothetical protein